MVTLRLKKMELQELRLAMRRHKDLQEETGLKWEEDQQILEAKLDKAQYQKQKGEEKK